jgi:hypothetical protein
MKGGAWGGVSRGSSETPAGTACVGATEGLAAGEQGVAAVAVGVPDQGLHGG